MKPLVIIAGATAVGKTELSVSLAKRIGGEIISADSMQIYKGFDIGTAKIKPSEMNEIPHYMIDELDGGEEFNVYCFKKKAEKYIDEIILRGKIPIIVGGTGFYIHALLYDTAFLREGSDKEYRHELEKMASEKGCGAIYQLLKETDPDAALLIHENNVKRIIRALEFNHETGRNISEHNRLQKEKDSPYNFAYFVLNRKREEIYKRIDMRVDNMIEDGLTDEVKNILDGGIPLDALSMQGIGYKEIAAYLNGKSSLDDAIYKIKLNTRHFAKRQLTWFRGEKDATWLDVDLNTKEELLNNILKILSEKEIIKVYV